MKRFLLSTFFLSVILLLTLLVGECIVRRMPNPYQTKHQQMMRHSDDVETLFWGSSHAYFGIRPEYIPRSFNLANTSQNLKYDYFMLEQYAGQCRQLKTVVLPISYFTLFSCGFEGTDNWWYAINYKIYMDCPYHPDFSKYNLELAHPSVYTGKLKTFLFGRQKNDCDSLGWGTAYSLASRLSTWETTDAIAAARRHTAEDWSHLEENLFFFRKIVSFCSSHSFSLILVTTPTWHAYHERLDTGQLDKMYEVIHAMQHEYALPYYDYLKDSRFVADDFYDSDHLSEVGARKFSLLLKQEVLDRK